MATVLYLAHRLPFPPNKGDKVRTHHLLRAMSSRHDVLLGTFFDDPSDRALEPELGRWCRNWLAVPMNRTVARMKAVAAVAAGQPFTVGYHRHPRLRQWVQQQCRAEPVRVAVVSCSGMAQYASDLGVPWLMDFIDMDSRKWAQYARMRSGPLAWLYRREARLLEQHDLRVAEAAECSYFVSQREAEGFLAARRAPGHPVEVLPNGVDADHFKPDPDLPNPYAAGEMAITFTGTMDYLPNVDAVTWFAREVMPQVQARYAHARFTVVGRRPSAAVQALAHQGVRVTGEVADVRPWLQHARLTVAPMRIAQGVQNKVLEAMAMGRPVLTAPECARVIGATAGQHLEVATNASDYQHVIETLLADEVRGRQLGEAGRAHVTACLDWGRGLAPLLQRLELFN